MLVEKQQSASKIREFKEFAMEHRALMGTVSAKELMKIQLKFEGAQYYGQFDSQMAVGSEMKRREQLLSIDPSRLEIEERINESMTSLNKLKIEVFNKQHSQNKNSPGKVENYNSSKKKDDDFYYEKLENIQYNRDYKLALKDFESLKPSPR